MPSLRLNSAPHAPVAALLVATVLLPVDRGAAEEPIRPAVQGTLKQLLVKGLEPSPPVRSRFIGLDRVQGAHQGREGLAADSSIAAGEGRVLQAANSALRLSSFDGDGAIVKNLNDFFGIPDSPLVSQPKVHYDRMAKRFYIAALRVDPETRQSAIHFATSDYFSDVTDLEIFRDAQNRGSWCTYEIPANFGAGAPAFPGSLALGHNEAWIALAADHFRYSDGELRIAAVYAIDKLSLSNFESSPCPTISFARLNVPRDGDRKRAAGLQPAQHYTNNAADGRPLYLVSSQALEDSSDVYTLWQLSGADTASLSLSRVSLRGDFVYTPPPQAPQRGGPDLDVGDARITQAAFRDGRVWAVHATGCNRGKGPEESCLRLVEITPTGDGGEITSQENLARKNLFLWAPGLAVNLFGDVLVPFQRSRSEQFLGTGYVVRRAAKGSFDAMRNLSNGQCPLISFDEAGRNVTGLAAGAQTDPRDSFGFWVSGEYAGTSDALDCAWRTRVGLARDRPPAAQPRVALASGEFLLPSTGGPELEVELAATVPAGLAATAGRVLVVALRDASRPGQTCVRDHPSNGCASVDYPLVEPVLPNSNWVAMGIGERRQRLYLTESQDLSAVPDPMKPD